MVAHEATPAPLKLLGPRSISEAAPIPSRRAQLGPRQSVPCRPPLPEARLPLVIDALVAEGELERTGLGQSRTVKVTDVG